MMEGSEGDVVPPVHATLKLTTEAEIDKPERSILLTRSKPIIMIGRASKVPSKGCVATRDNAWFDSPVMSRNHAEIIADLDAQELYVRDIGSLHGTFVDSESKQLKHNESVRIYDGSKLTFGVAISRNSESFSPASVVVGVTYNSESARDGETTDLAPGSTYAVPEFVDDDDSSEQGSDYEPEPLLDEEDNKAQANVVDISEDLDKPSVKIVDLTDAPEDVDTGMGDRTAGRLHRPAGLNVIDLTSPMRDTSPDDSRQDLEANDVEALTQASVCSEKAESVASSGMEFPSESSLHLSDIDTNDSEDSEDSEDSYSETNPLDRTDTPSSSGEDSEMTDSDENDDWDAEYSSDEDILDENDPDTMIWGDLPPIPDVWGLPPMPGSGVAAPLALNDENMADDANLVSTPLIHKVSVASPDLSTICQPSPTARSLLPIPEQQKIVPESQKEGYVTSPDQPVAPSRVSLHEILNPPARQASPSDAALPKRCVEASPAPVINHLPNETARTTAEALGEKTGKQEFFSAREANRLKIFPGPQEFVDTRETTMSKAFATETAAPHPRVTQLKCPTADGDIPPMSPYDQKFIQHVVTTPLLSKGDGFLARPMKEAPADLLVLPSYPGDDNDEPLSAFELQQRKLALTFKTFIAPDNVPSAVRRRTHVRIPDILDARPQEPEKPAVPIGTKRKAVDISTLSVKDAEWEEATNRPKLKIVPHIRKAHGMFRRLVEPGVTRVTAVASPQEPDHNSRPPKRMRLRSFVEALGYAALGGATVGAALVSGLIYTAPALA